MTVAARTWCGEAVAAARSRDTATARSAAYALFSQLMDSPHTARDAGNERLTLPPTDLQAVSDYLVSGLPFGFDLSALLAESNKLRESDAQRLARCYSGLFEVGSEGPAVPLREGLASVGQAGVREEIVRFYSFFGYRLNEQRRWAFDHLSTELEFLHFLAFKEAHAADEKEHLSLCLAQFDFLVRHPNSWYSKVREGVLRLSTEPYHRALVELLGDFLERDCAWQGRTFEGGN